MPFVQGGEVPDRVYATNATYPPLNDWGAHLKKEQLKKFHASPAEEEHALGVKQAKEARREARRRKHELFDAIVRVRWGFAPMFALPWSMLAA